MKFAVRSKVFDNTVDSTYNTLTSTGAAIRPASKEDVGWIKRIARQAHQVSYFFNDPKLDAEKCGLLFSEWAERCVNGVADEVLALTVDGEPAGMATLLLPKGLSETVGKRFGVLDFIAVGTEHQGKGLGKFLACESFRWLAERSDIMEARTMVNNYTAQRLYTGLGFQCIASDIHYHLWGER